MLCTHGQPTVNSLSVLCAAPLAPGAAGSLIYLSAVATCNIFPFPKFLGFILVSFAVADSWFSGATPEMGQKPIISQKFWRRLQENQRIWTVGEGGRGCGGKGVFWCGWGVGGGVGEYLHDIISIICAISVQRNRSIWTMTKIPSPKHCCS